MIYPHGRDLLCFLWFLCHPHWFCVTQYWGFDISQFDYYTISNTILKKECYFLFELWAHKNTAHFAPTGRFFLYIKSALCFVELFLWQRLCYYSEVVLGYIDKIYRFQTTIKHNKGSRGTCALSWDWINLVLLLNVCHTYNIPESKKATAICYLICKHEVCVIYSIHIDQNPLLNNWTAFEWSEKGGKWKFAIHRPYRNRIRCISHDVI